MEMKWIAIMVIGVMMCFGISATFNEYRKTECRTTLAIANRSVADIKEICK